MYSKIEEVLDLVDYDAISDIRKKELQALIDFIRSKKSANEPIKLNFICTHNSRRSQFAQIWALVAADQHKIAIESYSGGVEITECNYRTIESLERFGFEIEHTHQTNPHYKVSYSDETAPQFLFSKLFDDVNNPNAGFAAIMTCSHADENCPFVNGCEQRISIRYEDPKKYDDRPLESAMYDNRSFQIASEMMYVFSKV